MQTNPSPSSDPLSIFHPFTQSWFKKVIGTPTPVQAEAWPAIAGGGHTLVSAPTGTGKTLSAFLVFIDRLKTEARAGELKKECRLIYISPLKSLAGDIRENLNRPLFGIFKEEQDEAVSAFSNISVAIRTGDTSAAERRKMIKNPPHILITTPESLYLLITSQSGKEMLKTAEAVIIDELHAMIDTKRGAHMMLSLARLDRLCERTVQRIGLSATIEPLSEAADYLTGGANVTVAAPKMQKQIRIEVAAPIEDMRALPQGNIWPEIARAVYEECFGVRSVIAFVEGRMHAEKLAYQINQLAAGREAASGQTAVSGQTATVGQTGEYFARTHHGCVSKEQRQEAEEDLRSGKLRLLVATSSMELGIDVGDIDRVVQIAYPRSISSVLQRLGRAGHNPGRESVMTIYPRTVEEGLYCGLTADAASQGKIERLHPPRLCFDVLAQHLVSMATDEGYTVDEALEITSRAYPFREVTREDIKNVLAMLAGDYEHSRDLPVRPRVLYDRINERVDGDAYSRMLSVSAGGTIPDTGLFAVRTEANVKIGELDEEYVFEARVGDKFMLGSFAWKIRAMDKDTVTVAQSTPEGAQPPFWRHSWLSRKLQTGIVFGKRMRELTEAAEPEKIAAVLTDMGLDEAMAKNTSGAVARQIAATGVLADDRTLIAEHFSDEAGSSQIMIHSIYGRQVNSPLSILLQESARQIVGMDVSVFEDDDGILLMARGSQPLPERLLQTLKPSAARGLLEALLPGTPLFNMTFRYNTGRALMMGVRKGKRQPLWVQRLRSAEMLDSVIKYPEHPLIRETKRECLEDYWDLPGLEKVLEGIQSGAVQVREIYTEEPSPFSLGLRRAAEANFMYDYFPSTRGINNAVEDAFNEAVKIKPAAEQLARASERKKLPEDEKQLHSLLMTEGDLIAGELNLPLEWFEALADANRVLYVEPGLWIAAEQAELYEKAITADAVEEARLAITRRALRYRGGMDAQRLSERYFWSVEEAEAVLKKLAENKSAVFDGGGNTVNGVSGSGVYYHADLYEYARRETVSARRRMIKTRPPQVYAALMASRLYVSAPPAEQLSAALKSLEGRAFPPAMWESLILPARVSNYRGALLDNLLTGGEWSWRLTKENGTVALSFISGAETDWDYDMELLTEGLDSAELDVFRKLLRRGASFITSLECPGYDAHSVLMSLAEKGLAKADSFVPVRQWLDKAKNDKADVKRKVRARVMSQTSGRWELCRPSMELAPERIIERAFAQTGILCKETANVIAGVQGWPFIWEKLRVWEYTGQARRGYFIEGMSGAQFVHERDYTGTMLALETLDFSSGGDKGGGSDISGGETNGADGTGHIDGPLGSPVTGSVVWLSAADPLQLWGKILAHRPDRQFMCVSGTAVALRGGLPAAVFEKSGALLRVFGEAGEGRSFPHPNTADLETARSCVPGSLHEIMKEFAKIYTAKKIFPDKKRLTVKEYPPEAETALQAAGFKRVMMDYVIYQQ